MIFRSTAKLILFIIGLAPLTWLVTALTCDSIYGTMFMSVDPVQKLNRELGDWALIFLMVTLSVGPLSKILKRKNLIALRRMLGLLTYFYAVLHLTSYIIIDLQLDWHEFVKDVTKRNFIILGMTSVVLLTPLALTSNNISLKILGSKSWKKLHYLVYPAAIIAIIHFFMMIRADYHRPIMYASLLLALLIYRIWTIEIKNTKIISRFRSKI
ncbi:MAG: Protein-methionine-sulfoxide reductase heme-binding subunit MsrQ [Alphaproteobacteria bacterium MarineAlpha3_Bin7]|nr:MAG: Protein-methionine-sulfoxide reductase heme-binding subunit MsrQ [Alphaproteobacteria bacterium MarineAlpha3_Bin7]